MGQFFQAFVHLQPNIRFLFPHLTYPETLPGLHMHPSAKTDLEVNASGKIKMRYGLALSPDFLTPKDPFRIHAVSSLSQNMGRESGDPLILYSNRVLPLFIFAMTIISNCLKERSTTHLFCFCCYFHFRGQTGD